MKAVGVSAEGNGPVFFRKSPSARMARALSRRGSLRGTQPKLWRPGEAETP